MQQIKPMEPQRDQLGYWCHPDMPVIETSEQFDAWQAEQGFQYAIHCLDGDDGIGAEDALERYQSGDIDILSWQPSKPEGDGWFNVAIYDTEDGPVCLWIRFQDEEQKQLEALKRDFHQKRDECEKAAYAYFAALPVGDDRTFMSEVYQRIRLATSKSGKGA